MTIDYALQIARGETYIQTVDEIDYEREAKDVIFNAIRNGALIPEHHATFYQSEIIKEVILMILNHVRTDGDLAHFSFSEVKRLENLKKKLSGGGKDEHSN